MERPNRSEGVYDFEKLGNTPIPKLVSVAGWKEVKLEPSNEPMVATGALTKYPLFSSSIYFGEHDNSPYGRGQIQGSFATVFMREKVAERLMQIEKRLPRGYKLIIFDAYRSLQVQGSLYKEYYDALKVKHPEWTDDQLSAETQKYVSLPSNNESRPSPHNTGGSVDLGIIKLSDEALKLIEKRTSDNLKGLSMQESSIILSNAQLLDYGTDFDYGGKEAAIRYLEEKAENGTITDAEKEALKNRRILYHLMVDVGFEAYEDEWWHFNAPESQMGAKTAGLPVATYGGVELGEDLLKFEAERVALSEISQITTNLPKAAVIKPSN